MVDDGQAIHYAAVERGTPVYSCDEEEIGTVVEMLDNYREHIFDGVVFSDRNGVVRFADAPEVQRTAERGVTLKLTTTQAGELPPPEKGQSRLRSAVGRDRVGRLFRGGWRRQ